MSGSVELTNYGFRWDDIEVERTASVVTHKGRKPYHCITIRTPRRTIHVEVTPSGLLANVSEWNGVKP